MARLTPIFAHLTHAGEIVNSIARATVSATPDARLTLAHIDAAQAFMTAADALYEAAARVASGEPVEAPEVVFALHVAERKAAEGRAMLAGGDCPSV